MEIGKRQMLDKAAAFFKEFVSLAGKADHYVRADGSIRHRLMNLSDFVSVVPRAVLAMHLAQNAVTAGLQRSMSVLGDARRASYQRDQVVTPVHWLYGADANFFDARVFEERTDKLLKL